MRFFCPNIAPVAAAQNILPLHGVIIAQTAKTADGDVVVVFSNGGFGSIHGKLLDRLNSRR
jgi:UDP-N-acetylmuramate-alanine ligase